MTDVINFTKQAFTWTVVALTVAWSVGISALVAPVAANAAECTAVEAGDLVKFGTSPAVYVVDEDMGLHSFTNPAQLESWGVTYDDIVLQAATCISEFSVIPAGPAGRGYSYGLLTSTAGSGTVYVLALDGSAYTLQSPADAMTLWGESWESAIKYFSVLESSNYPGLRSATPLDVDNLPNELLVSYNDGLWIHRDGALYPVEGEVNAFVAARAIMGTDEMVGALSVGPMSDEPTPAADLFNITRNFDGGATTPGTETPAVSGELSVSLAANTPEGATIPKSAMNIDVLKFNVTAGSEAVTVDEVVVKRLGAGAVTGLSVYLYDGNTRIGTGRSFSSETNETTFSVLNVAVPANTTKTLTVRLQTGSTAGQHVFAISSVKATGADVSGTPIQGNTFEVSGNISAGTVTITGNGTLTNPTLGDSNARVAQFDITADGEEGIFESITLKQFGTIDTAHLSNFVLKRGTENVPVDVTVRGDYVTLSPVTDYMLEDGTQRIFTLYADISGSADVGDTIQFYMDKAADLNVAGQDYAYSANYGLVPTITGYDAIASGEGQTLTLQGGGVTIANLSESARDVKTDSNEVELMRVAITATDDAITIEKMTLDVATTKATDTYDYGTYKDTDADGDYDSGETLLLKDVKLIDADTGQTLGSGQEITAASNWAATFDVDATLIFVYEDYFSIAKGATRNIAVVADIDNDQISEVQYTATLGFGSSDFTVKDSQDNTVSDIVPAADVAGNVVTTRTSSLTVSRASTPESRTVVAGSAVDALGMIWSAGTGAGNDVNVSAVTLDVYVDASSTEGTFTLNTETETVATAANSLIETVSLYVGGEMIAGPVGVDTNGRAIFTSDKFVGGYYTVPAGTNKTVIVRAQTSGNAPFGSVNDALAFTLDANDITAEDADGTVTPTVSGTNVNGTTSPSVAITLTGNGTITTSADPARPTSRVLAADSNVEQEVHRVRLTATKENFVVEELTIQVTGSDDYDNVEYVKLYDSAGTALADGLSIDSNGEANFTGLSLDVPALTNTSVIVKAMLKDVGERTTATVATSGVGADPGSQMTFSLDTASNNFRAVGQASGVVDSAADAAAGNEMDIRSTVPTITINSLPTNKLSSSEKTVLRFSVSADAAGDVILGAITPNFVLNDSDADGNLTMTSGTLKLYEVTSGSDTLISTSVGSNSTVTSSNDGQKNIDVLSANEADATISAGTTKIFEVRATFSGVEDGDSVEVKLIQDSAALSDTYNTETHANAIADSNRDFIWSDTGADTSAFTSTEWANSYRLYNFPTTVTVLDENATS